MPEINWFAVLAAALAAFVLGGLWYSPLLFGKVWQREAGVTDEQLKSGKPAVIFGVSFIFALIASVIFAMFIGPAPPIFFSLGAGLAAGAGWVATSFGINYLFERKSLILFGINAGYHTLQFTLMGLILGLWH